VYDGGIHAIALRKSQGNYINVFIIKVWAAFASRPSPAREWVKHKC
jgi:hypothetical protein